MLLSHGAVGLFDMNGVRDSKNIINGLKAVKINGKNVREITGGKPLMNKTPIGFIIAYSDGTINRIPLNTFKVINVWYYYADTASSIIAGTPIYSEDDILICLTEDRKLKRIEAKSIPGSRKLQTGNPITDMTYYNENDNEQYAHLLMVAANGTYHLSDLDDIPIVSRNAAGVKSSYEGYNGKVILLPIPSEIFETERLFIGCIDSRDAQNYIIPSNPDVLKIANRGSKPKKLLIPEEYVVTSAAMIDIGDKTNQICMIGRNSTSTLGVSNFKKSYDAKRIFLSPLVISLI
jgi:hypothetical protein